MGKLYIVSTPIGNLGDITLRAIETLKGVDLILAEDTRVTRKLLKKYNIEKPIESYHQHSNFKKIDFIVRILETGKNIALVSDAGTPGINDPGGVLVEKLSKSNFDIIPIPGPNAVITTLSISGINADRFLFLGYAPRKKGKQNFFHEIIESEYPVVFYESPYRIARTLKELAKFDEIKKRELIVARELTKKFETVYRGTILEILPEIEEKQKGEFVVVIKND